MFPYVIFHVLCQILTPSWVIKHSVPYLSFSLTLSWKWHIVSMQRAASLPWLCGTHGIDSCNSLICLFWWACSSFPAFCSYTWSLGVYSHAYIWGNLRGIFPEEQGLTDLYQTDPSDQASGTKRFYIQSGRNSAWTCKQSGSLRSRAGIPDVQGREGMAVLWSGYLCFTAEAQRGRVICPRVHSE